jgi:glucosamine-phosphate N-acetyltransferase
MSERCVHTNDDHPHHPSIIDIDDKHQYIFDPSCLTTTLKQHAFDNDKLNENIYHGQYCIRPLSLVDYHHGYMALLSQLTECGSVTYEQFERRFQQMKQCSDTYYVLVVEDIRSNKQIVGTATLVCEKKFIRQMSCRGRIEDVVVNHAYRGQQLGKLLVDFLTTLAREQCHCYKISLECKDELVHFYEQFGYRHEDKQNYLCQRLTKVVSSKTNGQ